jgi:transposase
VAYLSGVCHLSRRQTEEVLEDLLGVPIALGTVSNLEAETSEALVPAYQEAAEVVQAAPVKNLDETGWKQCGKRRWLWTAATAAVAFFSIHKLRGEEGLLKLLGGKILGIFTSDRWSAYRVRAIRFRQICWAHLVRDFQKLIDRGGAEGKIGQKAKETASWIFPAWKDFKAGDIDRETLQRCLRPVRGDFKQVMEEGARLRGTKAAIFCQNLLDLEPALWTFTREAGVDPTNNHAERVLRRGVLWRKNCFGSASDRGARYVERMLTVAQSLRLQKRRVLDFLVSSVEAHRRGSAAPSLIRP